MPFPGPGLDHRPDDEQLLGFASLMPDNKRPGLLSRVLRAPRRLVALPARALRTLVRLPGRILGRRGAPPG